MFLVACVQIVIQNKMNYGVLIIARNEENSIKLVLDAIKNQTIKPAFTILINDNSTDKTKEIAQTFDIKIIDFPEIHSSWSSSEKLARVFNLGFANMPKNLDYYLIVGGDNVLENQYAEKILSFMIKNNYSISSGMILSERGTIRGSGRMISNVVLKSQDWIYPENYAYETYMLFKAETDGFKIKVCPDAFSYVMRKTGSDYDNLDFVGKGYKVLGYSMYFVFLMAVSKYYKKPKKIFQIIKGFRNCEKKNFYDLKIRQHTKQYEKSRMKFYLRMILNKIYSKRHSIIMIMIGFVSGVVFYETLFNRIRGF